MRSCIEARYNFAEAFGIGSKQHIGSKALDDAKREILPRTENEAWEAARALLRRPWFTRAWIVQEIAVARSVVLACGSWKMDWLILGAAVI